MSALVVCADLDAALLKILDRIKGEEYRLFEPEKGEMKVSDAREVIAEAFVASDREKYLIVKAAAYNAQSQNALLKLLEEPPPRISFYLLAPSRAVFLPTVRSRLPLEAIKVKKPEQERLIDFRRVDLEAIYEFNKNHGAISGARAKLLIEQAFEAFAGMNIGGSSTRSRFLRAFSRAFMMISMNSTAASAITPILLLFLESSAKTAGRH